MATWRNNTSPTGTQGYGYDTTIGVSTFIPSKNIVVTDVEWMFGADAYDCRARIYRVSDAVLMSESAPIFSRTGWQNYPITPVTLLAGVEYRVCFYAINGEPYPRCIASDDNNYVVNGSDGTPMTYKRRGMYKSGVGMPTTNHVCGLFGLVYTLANELPNAPTNLVPSGTAVSPAVIATLTPTVTWQHNDPDGNPQSGYQVEIRRHSDSVLVRDSGNVTSGVSSYAVPAGLTWGTLYRWRVRTRDAVGFGVYSTEQYFLPSVPPHTPTELSPSGGVKVLSQSAKDFSFKYTDPNSLQSAKYQLRYRPVGGAWVTSAEIVKVQNHNTTVIHTYAANTFTPGISYEWESRVQNSVGSWSNWSATSSFVTNAVPVTALTSPIGGVKKNAKIDITLAFSPTDADGTVSAYEVNWRKVGDAVWLTTGKVVQASPTQHTIVANALDYIGDPLYEWRVRAWDDENEVGSYSATSTFQAMQPYEPLLVVVGDTFNNGGREVPLTVTWTSTVPAGTTLTMEYQVALGDEVWGLWQPLPSGTIISEAHRFFRFRATLQASADLFSSPQLNTITLSYPRQFVADGEWIGPVFDLEEIAPGTTKFLASIVASTGSSAGFAVRTADDDRLDWSAWQPIIDGQAFPAANFIQVGVFLETADIANSVEVSLITLEALDCALRGLWISAEFDASNAQDKATGKMTIDVVTPGSSTVTALSRSSSDKLIWTSWAVAQVDGVLDHPPDDFVQVLLVLTPDQNGNRPHAKRLTVSFDGEPSTELVSSEFASGGQFYFGALLDFLVIVNGIDAPRKYDGDTLSLLGGSPPRGNYVVAHKNRLWMFKGSRLYFSDLMDVESWPILNFIDINPNDGDSGTGMYPSGDYLVITKSRSVWLLVGDSIDTYSVRRLSAVRGCLAPRSLTMINDMLCMVSDDGVYFSDFTQTVLASERLRLTWEGLNHRRLSQAVTWFHKQKLYVCLPSAGSMVNDTTIVFDTLRQAWYVIAGWGISANTLWTEAGRQVMLMGHSTEGQVSELDRGKNNAGLPIDAVWESKHFDMGYPDIVKRFRDITFMVTPDIQDVPLEVQFIVDGGTPTAPITVIVPGRPDKGVEVIRIDPSVVGVGYARSIGFRVRQATLDAAVGIRGMAMYFYPVADRPTIRA